MGRNHLHPILLQLLVQFIAVMLPIPNWVLWLRRLDHVKVEAQLNQLHLVVVRSVGVRGHRKAVAVIAQLGDANG